MIHMVVIFGYRVDRIDYYCVASAKKIAFCVRFDNKPVALVAVAGGLVCWETAPGRF
jgi:hypothetical protein